MNMKTLIWSFCALGAAIAISSNASALPVSVLSYDMINGNAGKYSYLDHTYNGLKTPIAPLPSGFEPFENALLTGGTGMLTDGIIGDKRWDVDEYSNGPNGSYVGWSQERVDPPTITFNLAPGSVTHAITIWVDDSDGIGTVDAPLSVTINGDLYPFIDPTPAVDMPQPPKCGAPGCSVESYPFVNTMPFSNTFVGDWTTDTLLFEFAYADEFIMISEIYLDYTPEEPEVTSPPQQDPTIDVPEPGTLAIFGFGLVGLGVARRRKSA